MLQNVRNASCTHTPPCSATAAQWPANPAACLVASPQGHPLGQLQVHAAGQPQRGRQVGAWKVDHNCAAAAMGEATSVGRHRGLRPHAALLGAASWRPRQRSRPAPQRGAAQQPACCPTGRCRRRWWPAGLPSGSRWLRARRRAGWRGTSRAAGARGARRRRRCTPGPAPGPGAAWLPDWRWCSDRAEGAGPPKRLSTTWSCPQARPPRPIGRLCSR